MISVECHFIDLTVELRSFVLLEYLELVVIDFIIDLSLFVFAFIFQVAKHVVFKFAEAYLL